MRIKWIILFFLLFSLKGVKAQNNIIFKIGADILTYPKYDCTSNGIYELDKVGMSF